MCCPPLFPKCSSLNPEDCLLYTPATLGLKTAFWLWEYAHHTRKKALITPELWSKGANFTQRRMRSWSIYIPASSPIGWAGAELGPIRVAQQDWALVAKLETALKTYFLLAFFHSLSHFPLPVGVSWVRLPYKLVALEFLSYKRLGNPIKVVKFLLCKMKNYKTWVHSDCEDQIR